MTRAEFIQRLVIGDTIGPDGDGSEASIKAAGRVADNLEKSGLAPWSDTPSPDAKREQLGGEWTKQHIAFCAARDQREASAKVAEQWAEMAAVRYHGVVAGANPFKSAALDVAGAIRVAAVISAKPDHVDPGRVAKEIALAVAQEREECARIADRSTQRSWWDIAREIRDRGEK